MGQPQAHPDEQTDTGERERDGDGLERQGGAGNRTGGGSGRTAAPPARAPAADQSRIIVVVAAPLHSQPALRAGAAVLAAAVLGGCPGSRPSPSTPADPEAAARQLIAARPQEVQPRLALLALLLAADRRQDALDVAEEAHQAFPDSTPVRDALADARAGAAFYPEAFAALRPLVGLPRYRIKLASLLIRNGRRAEGIGLLARPGDLTEAEALLAAQSYLDALEPAAAVRLLRPRAIAGASQDVLVTCGLAQLQAGDYPGAEATLEQAAAALPRQGVVRYYAGVAARLGGRLDRLDAAESHLQTATVLSPDEPFFHYELGLCRTQLRDLEGARAALEAAAERGPEWPEIQRDLYRVRARAGAAVPAVLAQAEHLRLLDDSPGAARVLREARARIPDSTALLLALSSAEHAAGRFGPALSLLREQRAAAPRPDPKVLWAEFRLQRSLQHFREAEQVMTLLEAQAPDDLEVLEEKADLLERTSRYAEAEALLRRLREREPDNPYRSYRLGYALSVWYRTAEADASAEAELRRAVQLRPENRDANYALGMLLQRSGRAREALPFLRAALDRRPTDRDALRVAARAYAETGDTARAARAQLLLRRLRARDDQEARLRLPVEQRQDLRRSRFALARFHLDQGELTDALRQLELLVHRHPDDRSAQALLARLYGHGRRFQRQFETWDAVRGAR
jgi:predicted Zn-dependent protease